MIKRLLSLAYLPYFLLISSLFTSSLLFQYFSFLILLLFFLTKNKIALNKNIVLITFSLTILATISWLYNLFTLNTDAYSLLLWLISFIPPYLLATIAYHERSKINFFIIFKLYKYLVIFQCILLIITSILNRKFLVGDLGVGTIGDANFVAFHICIVILFEVFYLTKGLGFKDSKQAILKVLEIFFFLIVLIIPESTANIGFLGIILAAFITQELIKKLNLATIIVFTVIFLTAIIVTKTFVYERFEHLYYLTTSGSVIGKNPYFNKVFIYQEILNGHIYDDANILIGSGPGSFTSRVGVMRIPEARYNTPPIEVPYFKSPIFSKFVEEIIRLSYSSSYGNFGSPQTSIITVAVELGILGLTVFLSVFYYIFKKNRFNKRSLGSIYYIRFYFIFYFSLFFIMNLLFLNFWEYPIFTFTYVLFVFLLL